MGEGCWILAEIVFQKKKQSVNEPKLWGNHLWNVIASILFCEDLLTHESGNVDQQLPILSNQSYSSLLEILRLGVAVSSWSSCWLRSLWQPAEWILKFAGRVMNFWLVSVSVPVKTRIGSRKLSLCSKYVCCFLFLVDIAEWNVPTYSLSCCGLGEGMWLVQGWIWVSVQTLVFVRTWGWDTFRRNCMAVLSK